MKSFTKYAFLSLPLLLTSLLCSSQAKAQSFCGFDDLKREMLRKDPTLRNRQAAFNALWQQVHGPEKVAQKIIISGSDTVYEIPVVVHIIHRGDAIGTNYNPADATIQNAINELNQHFAATFPGNPTPGSGGVNMRIRLTLAQRDPSCNPTNGINRINGITALSGANSTAFNSSGVARQTANGISDETLKGIVQWPPNSYYNIWIVPEIDNWDGFVAGSGVAAYATLPGGPATSDGTVSMAAGLSSGSTTITHEMGHAFNLEHPFEGGCVTGNCATTGDMVCDTDPQTAAEMNCPAGNNPCTNTSWVPLINNIMGYSSCPNRFTQGQAERALLALKNMRGSLLQSLGTTAPGTDPVQPSPAVAGCPGPGVINANNDFDIGPRNIVVGDLQSSSEGYTNDGNLSYINRTAGSCLQPAIAPAHLQKGATYNVSVGTGFNAENVRIYLDYNNDGAFTGAGELIFSGNGPSGQSYYTHTGTFTVPNLASVVENTYVRMRVVSDISANPQPCTTLQYGQAEDFAVIINQVLLPVTLKTFAAKAAAGRQAAQLLWETAGETAFSHYEIERSGDGQTFTGIGRVNGKGSNSSYTFEDAAPIAPISYYRLKMVDRDGRLAYSAIKAVAFAASHATALMLFPNPAHQRIAATVPESGHYTYNIVNTIGQQALAGHSAYLKQGEKLEIDFSAAAPASGVYYLLLSDNAGNQYRAKFIIE